MENKCFELGIDEITVLKHYSSKMPNGMQDWICWHRIYPRKWQQFLDEYSAFINKKIKFHSGVETELCNEAGDINIPDAEQKKIDMCALSVHYMINLDCLDMDLMIYPILSFCPEYNNEKGQKLLENWKNKVIAAGEENIVKGIANGYRNAILRHSKIKTLAHMSDGILQLRRYLVEVDKVGEKKCTEIFEPLMKTMAEKNVLWELTSDEIHFPLIIKRASELGVKFCATADGHQLENGWGPLKNHILAEQILDKYNLPRGEINL
ncbi:MAG: hypothetical protein RR246_01360 [Clostridia bacterium]